MCNVSSLAARRTSRKWVGWAGYVASSHCTRLWKNASSTGYKCWQGWPTSEYESARRSIFSKRLFRMTLTRKSIILANFKLLLLDMKLKHKTLSISILTRVDFGFLQTTGKFISWFVKRTSSAVQSAGILMYANDRLRSSRYSAACPLFHSTNRVMSETLTGDIA